MSDINKYSFAITTSSLRLKEMIVVAQHLADGIDLDITNDLGAGKRVTGIKIWSELKKRLSSLNANEIDVLLFGDLIAQRQIAFLSVCKTYGFLRDFVVEVVREKFLVFDNEITEGDYISFFRRKTDLHPEMDELTEITQKKIQQVTFKILEQAGIIDNVKTKIIQPQLLDKQIIDVIISDDADWLKVFLISDMDIVNLTQ